MRMGGIRFVAMAAAMGAAVLQVWPASAAAQTADPPPTAAGANTGDGMRAARAVDPATAAARLVAPAGRARVAAGAEAADRATTRNRNRQVSCATVSGVTGCVGRRFTTDAPVVAPSAPLRSGAFSVLDQVLPRASGVCDSDPSFKVLPVMAYTGASPDPARVAAIDTALGNVETAFTQSAARTGGSRTVRWVTDSGAAGCHPVLRTAHITTGATDFDALLGDLVAQGAVTPELANTTTKYLIFTEGTIDSSAPNTCGLGRNFGDDRPLDLSSSSTINVNLVGTHAAIDLRCWDINGGGSVPAHELMHTLGAVQDTAPHAGNAGHCTDEYDLMCYGPGMTYPCPSVAGNALFDCNNDDYFNTDPLAGQYLCSHWNSSDSLYLEGWDVVQPPRQVSGLTASGVAGGISGSFGTTESCYGADSYRVDITGLASFTANGSFRVAASPGYHSVTVTPYASWAGPGGTGAWGTPLSVGVMVPDPVAPAPVAPNAAPSGDIVLSVTKGRGYGLLAWAIDPETDAPARMRVTVEGVSTNEYDWNYWWDDMPAFTGRNHHESLVFLAQLPPGTRNICVDAQDPQSAQWARIGCRSVTVK